VKKTTKKTEKKAKIEAPAEVIPYLTREEQLSIEDATNATEKARLHLQIAEQVLTNKQLEKALFERNIKEAENARLLRESEYRQRAKSAGQLVQSLKQKYGVDGDFQYDPTSGRIIK
jgi:hypothetical protein